MLAAAQDLRRRVFGRFKPGIWLITTVGFLNAAGFAISLPFLSLYLYQERGISMSLVGVIILVSGLCASATQLLGGALSDRFGRRPMLLGSIASSIVLYLGMAVLIGVNAPVLAIAAIYAGVRSVLMMMRPTVYAMVADLSPKDRLTEAYGLLRVGQNVGWAAGPAVGGYLVAFVPYAWLFGFAGLTIVIGFCLVFFFLHESFRGTPAHAYVLSVISVAKDSRFLGFTVLALLVFVVMSQMATTLSVFTVDRAGFSTSQYGLLLTLNGLLVVVFQYPLARVTGKIAKCLALSLGSLLYGLGYLSMGWVGGFGLAMGAMVVVSAGEMTFSPTSQAVVGELAPSRLRGHYMGFFGLSENLGMSVGPLLGGVLLDMFPTGPLYIWGVISLVAFVAAAGFWRWSSPAAGP